MGLGMTKTHLSSSAFVLSSGLWASLWGLALFGSACTTLHLPQVYLRASLTPATTGRAEAVAFDLGLVGPLGEVDPPEPLAEDAPDLAPTAPRLGPSAPCRVSAACAWERRAVAEARARVIGGQP